MSQALENFSLLQPPTTKKSGVVVSFVVPALNEEKWIADCINSIQKLTLPSIVKRIEIIVVDNESSDRTVELSRSNGAKVVTCSPCSASLARNTGAEHSDGDWLAFVDADCCLDSNWLIQSSKAMNATNVVAVGSLIVPPMDSASWVVQTLGQLAQHPCIAEFNQVRWLPTAGLLIKKAHFDSVRGFDESLVTCEDCDLGYRLSERGRLMFVPAATLIHYGESKTLHEVLWREAWRTQGNIRLALSRPRDWKNWISLLIPIVFVLFILTGFICAVAACLGVGSLLVGLVLIVLGVSLPLALVMRKLSGAIGALELSRRWVVTATFLAGRALGLVWRFPRVER